MNFEQMEMASFTECLRDWATKRAAARMLEPGELVTREDVAKALKPRKWRERDFDDNQPGAGGSTTAGRTASHPAFD